MKPDERGDVAKKSHRLDDDAVCGGGAVGVYHAKLSAGRTIGAGKEAQDFLVKVDGKNQRVSDFRGKVVVLNFGRRIVLRASKRYRIWTDCRNGSVPGAEWCWA